MKKKKIILLESEIRQGLEKFHIFPENWCLPNGMLECETNISWKNIFVFFPEIVQSLKYNSCTKSWFRYDWQEKHWIEEKEFFFVKNLFHEILVLFKIGNVFSHIKNLNSLYSYSKMKTEFTDLPQNSSYFVFQNGVYDVKNEVFMEPDPKYFTTKFYAFNYVAKKEEPEKTCEFLSSWFSYFPQESLAVVRLVLHLLLTRKANPYRIYLEVVDGDGIFLLKKFLGELSTNPYLISYPFLNSRDTKPGKFVDSDLLIIDEVPQIPAKFSFVSCLRSNTGATGNFFGIVLLCARAEINLAKIHPSEKEVLVCRRIRLVMKQRGENTWEVEKSWESILRKEKPQIVNWALSLSSAEILKFFSKRHTESLLIVLDRAKDLSWSSRRNLGFSIDLCFLSILQSFVQNKLTFSSKGEVSYSSLFSALKDCMEAQVNSLDLLEKERKFMKKKTQKRNLMGEFESFLSLLSKSFTRKRKREALLYVGFCLKE